MKLLTEEQRTKLLANGTRRGADHKPVVKWFNAGGAGTWLVSELDPEYPDECAFGLADLGFGTPESGSVGLLELTEYRGPFGLGIERDIHFTANYSLSIYAEAARAAGHIVESGPELEAAARRCHVNRHLASLWAPTPEIMQRSSLAATVSSRRRGIGGVFGGRPDGVGR